MTASPDPARPFLTIAEAATEIGIAACAIRQLCRESRIPCARVGYGERAIHYRIARADLPRVAEIAARGGQPAPPDPAPAPSEALVVAAAAVLLAAGWRVERPS